MPSLLGLWCAPSLFFAASRSATAQEQAVLRNQARYCLGCVERIGVACHCSGAGLLSSAEYAAGTTHGALTVTFSIIKKNNCCLGWSRAGRSAPAAGVGTANWKHEAFEKGTAFGPRKASDLEII